MENKNGYNLEDQWWEFSENTSERVSPIHIALYFRLVRLNNRLKWVEVFGVPTEHTMHTIGIKSYRSYKRAFDDLVLWGFIKLIEKSHNQYTSNQVALVLKAKAKDRALILKTKAKDKASAGADVSEAKAEQAYINYTNKKTYKQDKKKPIHPSLEEVKQYFDENEYSPEAAIKAYNHYSLANWHDVNNKPVLNWKQKMNIVWFKPENKKKVRMLA
jgi:hypothetical protein